MQFAHSAFGPRFRRYVKRRMADVPVKQRADIWELIATHPERVQQDLEAKYAASFDASPHGGLAKRTWALSDFFKWLAENWDTVLKILLLLISLVLEADET